MLYSAWNSRRACPVLLTKHTHTHRCVTLAPTFVYMAQLARAIVVRALLSIVSWCYTVQLRGIPMRYHVSRHVHGCHICDMLHKVCCLGSYISFNTSQPRHVTFGAIAFAVIPPEAYNHIYIYIYIYTHTHIGVWSIPQPPLGRVFDCLSHTYHHVRVYRICWVLERVFTINNIDIGLCPTWCTLAFPQTSWHTIVVGVLYFHIYIYIYSTME